MQVCYELAFQNELLVGSGLGMPGLFDFTCQTDEHGLPRVPHDSIRGILRAQCERFAPAVVHEIFGLRGGQPSGFLFSDARVGRDDRARWSSEPYSSGVLAAALTTDRMRVAIDPATRTAEEHKLFGGRYGLPLLALSGRIVEGPEQLRRDEPTRRRHLAALIIGLRTLLEIGGDRRRGVGETRVTVDHDPGLRAFLELPEADRWQQSHWEALVELALTTPAEVGQ